jgi:hypothetical protein
MKAKTLLCSILITLNSYSQFGRLSPADSLRRDSINKATQQDYRARPPLLIRPVLLIFHPPFDIHLFNFDIPPISQVKQKILK